MGIKSNFNSVRFSAEITQQAEMLGDRILDSFIRAGEKFLISAREQVQSHDLGTYLDQTTNLRNSIGYYIFRNGKVVSMNQNGKEGNNLDLIRDLILDNFQGYQLIGVAGMNYASHVESKGYNVISYQADQCIVDLTFYLETLKVIEAGSTAQLEETFIP
jgi:hypothetical protein